MFKKLRSGFIHLYNHEGQSLRKLRMLRLKIPWACCRKKRTFSLERRKAPIPCLLKGRVGSGSLARS